MKFGQNAPWLSMRKSVRGFFDIPNIFSFMRSQFTKIRKYSIRQLQNRFSSATNRNIEKASHTFVVYHLLIDIVHFVWLFVRYIVFYGYNIRDAHANDSSEDTPEGLH